MHAFIFGDVSFVDDESLRQALLRIPEVSSKVRDVQKVIDAQLEQSFDLFSFLSAVESLKFGNSPLKKLYQLCVELGILERLHRRSSGGVPWIVGVHGADRALSILTGEKTLSEVVLNIMQESPNRHLNLVSPTGVQVEVFTAFRKLEDRMLYVPTEISYETVTQVVEVLLDQEELKNFVGLSFTAGLLEKFRDLDREDVTYTDVLEQDPWLGWFWDSIRDSAVAI